MLKRLTLALVLLLCFSPYARSQSRDTLVILNEVMFNPPASLGANAEYIEIFNVSFTDSIQLNRWRFGDLNRQDTIQFPTGAIWLRPRQYAVIAGRNGFDSLYRYNIPPEALQLRLPVSAIGNGLGNSGDAVIIRNPQGDTIQIYRYGNANAPATPIPPQGVSLEKRVPNRDNSQENWGNGILFGTAGRQNSLTPFNRDLSLSAPASVSGRLGQTISIACRIRNRGLSPFGVGTELKLFESQNLVTPIQTASLAQNLAPNDSLQQVFSLTLQFPAPQGYVAVLENAQDENPFNDTARIALQLLANTALDTNIVFSEVMYDPPVGANSTADEFVEVFNMSFSDSINLAGWRFDNATLSDTGAGQTVLAPRSFAVIFGPSYFTAGQFYRNDIPTGALVLRASGSLSLSNSGDTILLRNAQGDTIARMGYIGRSSDKGFSLEKILLNRDDSRANYARSLFQRGTPGRANSVTPKNFDLSISAPSQLSATPTGLLAVSFTIRNRGLQAFGSGAVVSLFEDRDGIGVPNPIAPVASASLAQNLNPQDSLALTLSYAVPQTPPVALILSLAVANDEDTTNNLAVITLRVPRFADTSVVISEIMYDPPANANSTADEFLEVFNASATQSIDLRNWRVDNLTLSDTGAGQTVLAPRSFAVIFGPSYFTAGQFYRNAIPQGALVLRASGSLSFSNAGDNILLRNPDGDTIAFVSYVGDASQKGFSLEKISLARNDSASNYAYSSRQGGTPARPNTATPKQRDLELLAPSTLTGESGASVQIPFTIRNRGTLAFGAGATLSLLADNVALQTLSLSSNLQPQQQLSQAFSYSIPQPLPSTLALRLDVANDEDTLNNAQTIQIRLLSRVDANIVFSELMIDPPDGIDSDNNEFIELYNANPDSAVNLSGWRINARTISDTGSGNATLLPRRYAVIFPRNYFLDTTRYYDRRFPQGALVLQASGGLGLTNSGATVSLLNRAGDTVATLRYSASDVRNEFSLEKRTLNRDDRMTNYAPSFFVGGSPSKENTLARARRTEWNRIVVNEILYQPIQSATDFRPDQPDWIEIYNRSNNAIDLAGWTLSNAPNERGEFETYFFATNADVDYVLQPGEYAVISPDRASRRDSTRLVIYYRNLPPNAKLFFVATRSTFSNSTSGGLIWLRDNTGNTVDSVRYSPNWHSPFLSSTRGITLERINPNFPSNDARSWTSSTNREFGGTPASRNSVYAESFANQNVSGIDVRPNPFSPDGDGREDNCVIAYSLKGNVNRIRIRIYDVKGRLVRTLANSEPSGSSGEVVWDGFGENREKLRVGIYIILLESLDANSATIETLKKTVVLARPL
ncbi:MAG: lamin tail domain-containing protein [Chloroherpetonaceae bacterium]|nr:lamin tail domain-containing protein [Chloroherpetonaceae bacterium]